MSGTPKITLPVGFAFYQPAPAKKALAKEKKRLKSIGTFLKDRPKEPPRDPNYPTKQDIALTLLRRFGADFADIKVQGLLADALYGDKKFMDQASHCFGGAKWPSSLQECQQQIKNVIPLASSKKHLNHRILGRLEQIPSLKYRKAG